MCCASRMAFFHDDFAGRVATKVMQTAMAVREVVMKIAEVLLYVMHLLHRRRLSCSRPTDLRLSAPLLLWLAGYLVTMRYFIPRLGRSRMRRRTPARS